MKKKTWLRLGITLGMTSALVFGFADSIDAKTIGDKKVEVIKVINP